MDSIPYVEYKIIILFERISNKDEFDPDSTKPIYLARKLNRTREKVSELMNGLIKKGCLAVAETRINTEDGRIGTTNTWFVNQNIIYCSLIERVSR
ncbi:hypothetical protein COF80_25965 [Bacillus toyonensis]|uniref:Helix-turn-helix domain-containing protein n=1 Tax=Bacillus toyonensis TaxID=155322 RepID=A0AB73QRX3_9BACI|nr:hypothetical protein [Bacillus toyonensis]PEI79943.1 hypothetical protein CN678_32270 [Bacillus toyonensis]PEK33852.1 hypothetical protein CN586_31435 [Bacillus toyonensis]PEM40884.1 hypothetical protein CN636_23275 [Bacillus toyonensis]PHE82898.1 hypothetical protein COF80_25965 [Bacillus toyonensis]